MSESAYYFFTDEIKYDDNAVKKWITVQSSSLIRELIAGIDVLNEFNVLNIEKIFTKIIEEKKLKLVQIAQPVRVGLTGNTVSPGIYEVMEILGRERVLKRLNKVLDFVSGK